MALDENRNESLEVNNRLHRNRSKPIEIDRLLDKIGTFFIHFNVVVFAGVVADVVVVVVVIL